MLSKLKDKKWCHEQYVKLEKSLGMIAKDLSTYPNKVRRALQSHGIKLRDKSSAQLSALKKGRSEHPTQDKGHSEDTRIKISETAAENWENLSDKEKKAHAERARKQMENLSPGERAALQLAAGRAVRKAADEGSKLEKYIAEQLTKHKYVIEYHKRGLIPNDNLEVDIYLPDLATAIEIDGPSHFLPVWGEESLQRTIRLDTKKNGLLRTSGVMVLRVAQKRQNLSLKIMRDTWKAIQTELIAIEKKMPPKSERFKEIEI